jgi:hypothetical protein
MYFSSLQIKKKPHDGDTKHAFILVPCSTVGNSLFFNYGIRQPGDSSSLGINSYSAHIISWR